MAQAPSVKSRANGALEEGAILQQPPKVAVDASKLNDLMENLDKRLSGGLHGDYYEKGSKFEDKNRHGQLEAVFGLRKELSEIKAHFEKYNHQAGAEQNKIGKGPPQGSKNMIATIKTVVQQELSEKLRDLSVCNERLESSLKKANVRTDALETKNKTLEAKLKKADERIQRLQEKMSSARIESLERVVNKVDVDAGHLIDKLSEVEHFSGLRQWQQRNRSPVEDSTTVDNVQLQPYVFQHAEDIEWHTKRLDDLEERVKCRALR